MSVKSELRKSLKAKRKLINKKSQKDINICESLICSNAYLDARTILFYAAIEDEVNVDFAIDDALYLGKSVALPVCVDDAGNMEFYFINSLDDLNKGFFGVREPKRIEDNLVTNFDNAICVVPAIAYDKFGYRLGYGKGYYDRFLQKNSLISIGLCYNEMIEDRLPTDKYDVSVDYLITENGFIK